MKYFLMAIVVTLSFSVYSFAGCTGPQEVVVTPGGNYICCPVGDGSVSSCTNGTTWWLEPTFAE